MKAEDETRLHIGRVQQLLLDVIGRLAERAAVHDASKLRSPEVEAFEEFTPKLRGTTYGSAEYKTLLEQMRPALRHHYANNSHHPEHFTGSRCDQCGNRESDPCACGGPRVSTAGIWGMSLLDLVEMLIDWRAATERHADGDIRKSVEINQKRFGYGDELKRIFHNTLDELGL